SNLDFGIERVGQTSSGFTITVTPISANITSITSPPTQTGMSVLEQRNVSAALTLDPSIQSNDKIEYNVTLSNDEGAFYNINVEKYYQPTVLLDSDPQNGITDWNNSGWTRPAAGGYTGNRVFRTGNTVPYAVNTTKTLTTVNGYDFSGSDEVLIQFYSKWDIERNFDFVEFQASTNGTTWVNLNGKYTKPESSSSTNDHNAKSASDESFQGNNASGHIYDGDRMDNWVMEEIVIDASNNASVFGASNVLFRFRMRSDSENEFENYSANGEGFFIDDFKIIGLQIPCTTTVPTSIVANTITASGADIVWDNIPSATYDIRYREVGATAWTEVADLASTTYTITGLELLTDYEVQVRSRCTASTSDYSASVNFTTSDLVYCDSTATNTGGQLSIRNVVFNTINNNNSSVDVYSDFTSLSTTVSKNTTYSISITPRYVSAGTNNPVGYAVWIDYNRDGDFTDSGELVFSQTPITGANTVSGTINIPSNIISGNARMRVSMKFNDIPDPCESFDFGEVEDYTVNLFNGLLYSNSTWTPSAPNGTTNTEDIMILDGIYNANTNIIVNSVIVNTGAEISIDKANAITVNGNITNNGEFILNSDSNEFSSLLLEGSASGDLKYNRYVNSNTNRNDLVSPPFSGESFVDFLSNNSNVLANPTETEYLFGPFDKSASDYLTYSNTETTPLQAGKGYRAASIDANQIFTFTGAVTTGNLDVPIFKTGSVYELWNLIGNPYPSYIKLEDFLLENLSEFDSESVAVYGYDADNSNGSYWTIWNLAYASANPNTLIAPGQGFFVSSKDGGGTVAFKPSMRTSGSSDDFIAGRTNNLAQHGTLLMTSSSLSFSTDIYFNDNATLGLDLGYDASHFDGAPSDFSIYSELVENNSGRDMAIQAISSADISNNPIIPLGVNLGLGEQVTISLVNSTLNYNVYLEDVVTNTFTLLNTSEYTFTPTSDLSDTGRFYLRFDANILSTDETNLDNIQIYNDSSVKQIVVKGQLNNATTLTLYDIQGRTILRNNLNISNTTNTISTSGYSTGVYLVQLSNESFSVTKKLIIK
ncbi:MAG: GEVED domain-containing protein, partial [Winogradskyella sp.]